MSDVVAVVVIAALASELPCFGLTAAAVEAQEEHIERVREPGYHLSDPGMPVAPTTKGMASGDPLGPIWLRLRGERRVTLLDLALAGDAP